MFYRRKPFQIEFQNTLLEKNRVMKISTYSFALKEYIEFTDKL
jgi:hypothetical protein